LKVIGNLAFFGDKIFSTVTKSNRTNYNDLQHSSIQIFNVNPNCRIFFYTSQFSDKIHIDLQQIPHYDLHAYLYIYITTAKISNICVWLTHNRVNVLYRFGVNGNIVTNRRQTYVKVIWYCSIYLILCA
jgi:hypothetical protein